MGQIVVGLAGAAIGSFTPIGPSLGYALGSPIGDVMIADPKPVQSWVSIDLDEIGEDPECPS